MLQLVRRDLLRVAAALAATLLLAQPKKIVVTSSGYYYWPFSPSAIQELRAARKLKWVQVGVAENCEAVPSF